MAQDTIEARAERLGYGLNARAFAEGYQHDRTSPAIEAPGPARSAFQAGWIERQRDAGLEHAYVGRDEGVGPCVDCGQPFSGTRSHFAGGSSTPVREASR